VSNDYIFNEWWARLGRKVGHVLLAALGGFICVSPFVLVAMLVVLIRQGGEFHGWQGGVAILSVLGSGVAIPLWFTASFAKRKEP